MAKPFQSSYLNFWGKAKPLAGAPHPWHPAAYHCLDVAAVAEVLLARRQSGVKRMAARAGLTTSDLRQLAIFLIALHDIGKFSRSFQALAPEHWPVEILGDKREENHPASHWQLSFDLLIAPQGALQNKLMTAFGLDYADGLNPLIAAISGHHGHPPQSEDNRIDNRLICPACKDAAQAFMLDALSLIPPPRWPDVDDELGKPLSFWLAGLTVCADWLGSNQNVFCYHAPKLSLDDYWRNVAKPHAADAVKMAGLSSSLALWRRPENPVSRHCNTATDAKNRRRNTASRGLRAGDYRGRDRCW